MNSTPLRVLVADEHHSELDDLERLLAELGHLVTARAISLTGVDCAIADEQPDIAIVKVDADEEHALALIGEIIAGASCPVVALRETSDADFVGDAAELGVHAFVHPITREAVHAAIEIARRRHAESEDLEVAVDQLETALGRRAVIERAKGMLMERHGIDEHEAFELLRQSGRSSRRKVLDVARSVTEGVALPG